MIPALQGGVVLQLGRKDKQNEIKNQATTIDLCWPCKNFGRARNFAEEEDES